MWVRTMCNNPASNVFSELQVEGWAPVKQVSEAADSGFVMAQFFRK
jgi:hypothetical protein